MLGFSKFCPLPHWANSGQFYPPPEINLNLASLGGGGKKCHFTNIGSKPPCPLIGLPLLGMGCRNSPILGFGCGKQIFDYRCRGIENFGFRNIVKNIPVPRPIRIKARCPKIAICQTSRIRPLLKLTTNPCLPSSGLNMPFYIHFNAQIFLALQ